MNQVTMAASASNNDDDIGGFSDSGAGTIGFANQPDTGVKLYGFATTNTNNTANDNINNNNLNDEDIINDAIENDGGGKMPAMSDVEMAVTKYRRQKGTTYTVTFTEVPNQDPSTKADRDKPFGIILSSTKCHKAHSSLTNIYEDAFNEGYRGRPPSRSNEAVIVTGITDTAEEQSKAKVQRNDILLFHDGRLVNLTEKKPLKFYLARFSKDTRPMSLTFFRPAEGAVEPLEEESEDEVVKGASKQGESSAKKKTANPVTKNRRMILENRLSELESLVAETSAELTRLRMKDGEYYDNNLAEGYSKSKTGDEEVIIPPHIMYCPPTKVRRKQIPELDDACQIVERFLHQRQFIEMDVEKIRAVIDEAQNRLTTKGRELQELDRQMAPALDQIKLLEMDVKDNWKKMYLKLKDYYEQNGHSNVMEKEDLKLAKWNSRQRTCYANARMEKPNPALGLIKPYQYELLNQLQFCWNPREQQFSQNIKALTQFKDQAGHCNVPMKHENVQLANFVQKWRREYRLFQEGKVSVVRVGSTCAVSSYHANPR
eukprot:g10513.t1.2.5e17418b g10513  g10513.t1 contig4:2024165-2025796(+)